MEYIYGALLLHAKGKDITEAALTKIIEASGEKPDAAKTKALVASLDGVDIEEAIKSAAVSAAPAAAPAEKAEEKKDDKPSEEEAEKKAEEASAGLGALFG